MRRLQLRHVERSSIVHRLRADTKILCLIVSAMAVAFNPDWPVIGIGYTAVVVVFVVARLPFGVVGPPPRIFFFYVVSFGLVFSLLSGGDPVVGGVELGGVIEFAQFVSLSLLLIAMAAVLAWTTSISDVGLGLARLIQPLRVFSRVPADELGTIVALAVRSLPLVRDEIAVVTDARRTRPPRPGEANGMRAQLADAVDFGTTVVVGAHRRSRELAMAMVARNSLHAPEVVGRPRGVLDALALIVVVAGAIALFIRF